MGLEKLKSFKGVSAQRLLNAFNNNEITREEYRLLRRLEKENAWDQIEQLTTTQPETAPAKSAPANFAPAEFAPAKPTKSLPTKPTIKSVQSDKLQLLDKISLSKKFYKVPNEVMDKIPVHLTMAEEVVYHHMVRLSYGWGRNYCRVGYGYFLKKSSIKARATVVEAIKGLAEKGMIIPHKSDNGKIDSNNEGTLYIVCVPSYGIPNSSIPDIGISKSGIPESSIPDILKNSIPNSDIPSQTSITASNSEGILNSGIPINEHYKDNNLNTFKYTLSKDRANQYINSFYASLGQKRISKKERERAIEVYDSLKKEGFTEEEISFAVEWTINNVKDARSFAILEHTIGQALSEKEKILEQQALEEKREKERQAELEKRRCEEEESAKLDEYISNLSSAEREALESQARDELIRKEQIEERYINSMVLNAKVKEIIKREYDWK